MNLETTATMVVYNHNAQGILGICHYCKSMLSPKETWEALQKGPSLVFQSKRKGEEYFPICKILLM